jgi:2-oxoglutarate dehydrogenase E1 component
LLRHPLASSTLDDLAHGAFEPILDDPQARARADKVTSLVLCTGHVYVDLVASPLREETDSVAIARLEQLYPFPTEEIEELLATYPKLRDVRWVQEEPMNMGAWSFVASRLVNVLPKRVTLAYVGRTERASPAVGAHDVYAAEQAALVRGAFGQSDAETSRLGIEAREGGSDGSRDTRPATRGVAGRSDRGPMAEAGR